MSFCDILPFLTSNLAKTTNDFEKGIQTWYERPIADHIWGHFKDHFENAREVLKKICGRDMQNTAFQHVNFIANEVRADIAHTRDSIMEALAEREDTTNNRWKC